MFFNTHICNEYCEFLDLVNPRETSDLSPDFKLLPQVKIPKSNSNMVHKLCDLCKGGITVD